MNLLEALELSGDHFLELVATLDSRQLEAASVCAGWLVGDVGRHVVSGCRVSVALADGCSAVEALAERERPVGGPLASDLGEAIAQQLAALATDRPNGFVVHHPIVDMTLAQLIETRLVEFIVHGSDIARSIGAIDEIDAALAEVAWAAMAPLADITASLGVFGSGPSGELGDHATAAERLLDLTGRRY
jgi:uncharacterized protein (TIGR03086 family)